MSKKQPFAGKWQAWLDTGEINTLIGFMDGGKTSISGQSMIVYKTGVLVPVYDVYLGIAQLQPDGVSPTRPAALAGSYLQAVPYSGNIYRPNGISGDSGAQVWAYNDSSGYAAPTFGPNSSPAGAVFGWWNTPSFPQVWGWLNSSSPPPPGKYSIVIKAPSAFHMRGHQAAFENGDYTWCDLSGEDYSKLSMRGAVFAGADLSGTDFGGTDLTGADFRSVYSLTGARFTGAILSKAKFDGLDLTGYNLSSLTMQGASLAGAKLAGASLAGSDLSVTDLHVTASFAGADVTNANLTGCRFGNMDLTGFSFPGAILSQASFTGTVLAKAQFAGTSQQKCDLSEVDFRQAASLASARFSASLHQAVFSGLDLTGLDFTGADATGARFDGCDLRGAIFSANPTWSASIAERTDMTSAKITLAQLGTKWSNVDLTGTEIDGLDSAVNLSNLQARGTVLTNRDFGNRNMQKCDFTNADLRGTTFAKSNLSYSLFVTALLHGDGPFVAAVFSGAVLTSCDFTGAQLSGVTFNGAYFTGTVKFTGATMLSAKFDGAYLGGADFTGITGKGCQGSSFSRACLVNATFEGTSLVDDQGSRLPMWQACLQGANFTKAQLHNADLTDSAVSTGSGTIYVTVMQGWPLTSFTPPSGVSYGPTIGIEGATDAATVCPNGEKGDETDGCSGAKLIAPGAPTKWP